MPSVTPGETPSLSNCWTWFSEGDSSYHALQVDLRRRFSGGFLLRGVYTFSRTIDDGDSLNQTTAANAPGLVSNPFNLRADKGLATFDVRSVAVINALSAFPFGRRQSFATNLKCWSNNFVAARSVASIVNVQSGFPFTPQLSYTPSNKGDTRNT